MSNFVGATAADAGVLSIGGDLVVNRFGFGAMRITGQGAWGEPKNRAEVIAVLRRAVELGVNLIDTADAYGPFISEQLIAEALTPYPEDLVIATKAGLIRPGPTQWQPDGSPEHLKESCDASLRRLGLEQIPLYQFHRVDPSVPLAESIGALVELKEAGKVRHIGLSNVSVEQLREAQRFTPIATVQNRFNLGDRSSAPVLEACEQEGIAFLPWAPIVGAEDDSAAVEIARTHGVSATQIALAWLLEYSKVMLPIAGTSSTSHLEENLAATAVSLSAEEVARLT
jgi:aryl-alcohol dehydrogenase-like predicted oxidoreductase